MKSSVSMVMVGLKPVLLLAVLGSFNGVVSAQQAAATGVDCSAAPDQLAHLHYEKKSTAERIFKGVTSIVPIGLVIHAATGQEKQDVQIASGEYNRKIDQRMAQIEQQCGLRASDVVPPSAAAEPPARQVSGFSDP